MKLPNKAVPRSRFPSLFVSFLLISAITAGPIFLGCGSKNGQVSDQNTNGTTPPPTTPPATPPATPPTTPPGDPLATAKTYFKDNVFGYAGFFKSDRCLNCHNFDDRHTNIFISTSNPPTVHPDKTANCASCHTPGLIGFTNFPLGGSWRPAPAGMTWTENTDSDTVRQQIIDDAAHGHDKLFKHLCGEGPAEADPFVQWCFYNGTDTDISFLDPNKIHPGAVPGGGPHAGRIVQNSPPFFESEHGLMDWDHFKKNIKEWMCLEAKVPGSTSLGLPATVVCP